MFLSGILPMSSAVTTSTIVSAFFFVSSDFSSDARMPVTVTVSVVCGACLLRLRMQSQPDESQRDGRCQRFLLDPHFPLLPRERRWNDATV